MLDQQTTKAIVQSIISEKNTYRPNYTLDDFSNTQKPCNFAFNLIEAEHLKDILELMRSETYEALLKYSKSNNQFLERSKVFGVTEETPYIYYLETTRAFDFLDSKKFSSVSRQLSLFVALTDLTIVTIRENSSDTLKLKAGERIVLLKDTDVVVIGNGKSPAIFYMSYVHFAQKEV